MKKRVLSVLLAIVMVVGMFPVTTEALPAPPAVETHAHDMSVACGGSSMTFEPWDGTTTFPGGNVYLTDDITLTEALTISGTVNLCLNGHVLAQSGEGCVIAVGADSTLNLCDCNGASQSHKFTVDSGTGLWTLNEINGSKTVTGGIITGGKYSGIYVWGDTAVLNQYGGHIVGNQAEDGGGVYLDGSDTYTNKYRMFGGSVIGNTATECGGGIYIYRFAEFELHGGTVSSNRAGSQGGGIYTEQGGGTYTKFTMTDGTVSGNTAADGGGIYSSCAITMSGGSITGNTASDTSGGVYARGTMTMSGGSITGNTAGTSGGGLYLYSSTTSYLVPSGKVIINNNTLTSGVNNNVYKNTSFYTPVKISGTLDVGSSIGISFGRDHTDYPFAEPDGDTVTSLATGYKNYFFSDDSAYVVVVDDVNLKLAEPPAVETHSHPVCGATCTHDDTHSPAENWTELTASDVSDGTLSLTDGTSYYLGEDISVSASVEISGTVNLCLNGRVLEYVGTGKESVIKVTSDATLTICDCTNTTHTGYINSDGLWEAGMPSGEEAAVTLTGGIITGGTGYHFSDNNYYRYGGGIFVDGGTLNLYGGNIAGNLCEHESDLSKNGGGGVYVKNGTFNMYDGTITGNCAMTKTNGGGGLYLDNSTFNMSGGKISQNKAYLVSGSYGGYGGGIYVFGSNSQANLSGTAEISGNSAYSAGGGINLATGSITMSGNVAIDGNEAQNGGGVSFKGNTFTINGGSISNNTATGSYGAGGVEMTSGSITMNDGSISNNTAAGTGGGVRVYDGTFTMAGGSISGNKTTGSAHGGGVYIYNNGSATFAMTAGKISGNTASGNGGGVYNDRVFQISGGEISGNIASVDGGGVYANKAVKLSGAPTISGNTVNENSNNVSVSTSVNIAVVGELTNTTPIGVTVRSSGTGKFASPSSDVATLENGYADKFKSDNPIYDVIVDGNNLKLQAKTIAVTGVTLNKSSTSITVGGTEQLTATVLPNNATNKTVAWSSGAESIATVDSNGKVTAKNVGTATITASAGGKTATCTVTVNAKALSASNVTLSQDSFAYDGSAKTPTVTVKDGDTVLTVGTDYTVSYSDNTNAGTGKVTVTFTGNYSGSAKKNFTISKATQEGFAITGKPTGDIAYGGSFILSTAGGSGGGAVSWAVTAGEAYAEIDSTGKVTIKGVGEVTITATKAESANYKVASDAYTFTSVKATPVLGTVSVSGTVKDTTSPAAVVLTKTAGPEGTFAITDAAMLANKDVYSYTFTPDNTTNYNTVTGTVQIDVKDTQVPSATIKVDTKEWKEKLNGITFGIFFKNSQTVTITYADNENGSGLKDKLYYAADKELSEAELAAVEWKNYGTAFNIDPDGKFVIYAKVTDNDGNNSIVNSNGIILDETQAVIEGITNGGTYYGNVTITASDALTGVKEVKVDGAAVTLSDGKYTIEADNAEHTVLVTDNADNTTTTYTITVYKQYTVAYVADGQTVSEQTVNHGADATVPAIPTKQGYTQVAPYWDGDGKNITTNTTITAVYTINKYTVTYKADGQVVDTQTIEHGANATPPTVPAKEGYTQIAPVWDKDGKNITVDTEINAVYTINKYTVTYVADGEKISTQTIEHGADATVPAVPAKEGYTQVAPYWDKDGKNITTDTEINAVYTINKYNVTFNSNGGNKVDGIPDVIHGTVITAPTAPTKENATFAGWFSDSACTKAWNFDTDTVTADLTLYAKWSDVPVYHISGKVEQETDVENVTTPVANATVKLMLGNKVVAEQITEADGTFYFGGQIAGDYNVVVTYRAPNSEHDKVVTALVEVHGNDADGIIVTLPQTVTNSIVKHEPAADGKDSVAAGTLVGGLEDVAAAVRDKNRSADKVEVKLTVKDTPPVTGTPTAGSDATKQQAQQKAIQQKAGGKQLVFFDLSVVKTINNGAPETITDTGATLLEIRIPFDSGNKWGITIYRYHGDKAEVLAAVREGSTTEGFWVGDDGYIHIYTHKFSTYAVGYTVPSYGYFVPITPDTVTSADTFDAGIVVYVTMSMLAATGSAVVIGKKRKEEN